MRILSKLILFCLLTLSVKAQPAFPTNVVVARLTNNVITLAWDRAASHTNIECFKLYVGIASGIYNTNYTTTNTTISISNLVGYVFYFTVTAKGSNGLESDYSNQISFDARRPEPPAGLKTVGVTAILKSSDNPAGPFAFAGYFGSLDFAVLNNEKRFYQLELKIN